MFIQFNKTFIFSGISDFVATRHRQLFFRFTGFLEFRYFCHYLDVVNFKYNDNRLNNNSYNYDTFKNNNYNVSCLNNHCYNDNCNTLTLTTKAVFTMIAVMILVIMIMVIMMIVRYTDHGYNKFKDMMKEFNSIFMVPTKRFNCQWL